MHKLHIYVFLFLLDLQEVCSLLIELQNDFYYKPYFYFKS